MSNLKSIKFDGYEKVRLVKWSIRPGGQLSDVTPLFTYNQHGIEKKFRSSEKGTVKNLLVGENDLVSPGQDLIEYERCAHNSVLKDLCVDCGLDLRQTGGCQRMSGKRALCCRCSNDHPTNCPG